MDMVPPEGFKSTAKTFVLVIQPSHDRCMYLKVVSVVHQAAAEVPDDLPLYIFGLVVDLVAEERHGVFHRHVVIALAEVVS